MLKTSFSAISAWVFDSHSRRMGMLYLLSCIGFLLVGVGSALVLQLDMLTPSFKLISPQLFAKLLTEHGMVMVFLFLLPLFPGVFGHLVLPSAVGVRDLALKKLNVVAWVCHVIGGLVVIVSIWLGAYDGGWTMMMPHGASSPLFNALILGLALSALSVFLLNFSVVSTIALRRYRKIHMAKIPLLAWFFLFGGIIHLLITPIRLATLFSIYGGGPFLSPVEANGIILYQQAFWIYAGPAIFATILPAIGVTFEVLAAYSSRLIVSRTKIAATGVLLTILGLASWGKHLIAAADQELAVSRGGFLSLMIIPPLALILLNWFRLLGSMRNLLTVPLLFVWIQVALILFGGFGGVMLAVPALGINLHDTYFTVAHLHLAVLACVLGAAMAGLFHWWVVLWKKEYSHRLGIIAGIGIFAGISLTFLPMYLLGARGLPRALNVYPETFRTAHILSSIGTAVLTCFLLLMISILSYSIFRTAPVALELKNQPLEGEFSYSGMIVPPSRKEIL